MSNFIFNSAKGKVAYYADSVQQSTVPNDALVIVPFETAGMEVDATLIGKTTLQEILNGTSNEQTTMGRVTLTGVSVVTNTTTNVVTVDAEDFVYSSASGSPISAFIVFYVPDLGTSTDAEYVALTKHDFSAIPNGNHIPVQVSSTGIFSARAQSS